MCRPARQLRRLPASIRDQDIAGRRRHLKCNLPDSSTATTVRCGPLRTAIAAHFVAFRAVPARFDGRLAAGDEPSEDCYGIVSAGGLGRRVRGRRAVGSPACAASTLVTAGRVSPPRWRRRGGSRLWPSAGRRRPRARPGGAARALGRCGVAARPAVARPRPDERPGATGFRRRGRAGTWSLRSALPGAGGARLPCRRPRRRWRDAIAAATRPPRRPRLGAPIGARCCVDESRRRRHRARRGLGRRLAAVSGRRRRQGPSAPRLCRRMAVDARDLSLCSERRLRPPSVARRDADGGAARRPVPRLRPRRRRFFLPSARRRQPLPLPVAAAAGAVGGRDGARRDRRRLGRRARPLRTSISI